MFEYWAHVASLSRSNSNPLLRWRMARAHERGVAGDPAHRRDQPALLDDVLRLVARAGPDPGRRHRRPAPGPRPGHMWNWHDGKIALEYLSAPARSPTAHGSTSSASTTCPNACPAESWPRRPRRPDDAQRELVRIAAARPRHRYRARPARLLPALARRRSKTASPNWSRPASSSRSTVDGWAAPAYLWHEARRPAPGRGRALLSPFDSLVWFRERTERLFGFRYRIEIYTPEPKRQYGYYVLPFLLGEDLVARVDLKADRQAGVLRVQSAWLEAGYEPESVAGELAGRTGAHRAVAGLDAIDVRPRGDLAARPRDGGGLRLRRRGTTARCRVRCGPEPRPRSTNAVGPRPEARELTRPEPLWTSNRAETPAGTPISRFPAPLARSTSPWIAPSVTAPEPHRECTDASHEPDPHVAVAAAEAEAPTDLVEPRRPGAGTVWTEPVTAPARPMPFP